MHLLEPSSDTNTGKVWLVIRGCLSNPRLTTVARSIVFLALLSSHAPSLPQTVGQPQDTALDPCRYSEQIYTEDAILMRSPKPPTHFPLMASRYLAMVRALRAYRCIGTVMVGFDGHRYLQINGADDPGMMELIPTFARLSGLPLSITYDVTMIVVISFGLFVGYAGFCKLFPEASSRSSLWIGASAFILVGLVEARVADEYVFQVSPLMAGIPWLVYFALTRRSLALTSSAALLAFCCSWCSLARSGTIVVCASFLIATFILRYRIQRAVFPLVLFALACVPPVLFQQFLVARRNVALARMGVKATAIDRHALWHTAYIGLGFISNSEVSEYRDGVAADKVRSIDPTVAYGSPQYETILRNEVWSILKRKPMIVMENLAAKACVVTLLGLLLLFPARNHIFVESEVLWFDIALLSAAAISAVNVLVAVPRLCYLLTFSCLGILYSTVKVCRAIYQTTPARAT